MLLLANGMSRGNSITVIALCIAIFVIMAVNFLLLVYLNKKNKKAFKERDEEKDDK